MMDLTENMFKYVAEKVLGTTKITYGEHEVDLGVEWERITMNDVCQFPNLLWAADHIPAR